MSNQSPPNKPSDCPRFDSDLNVLPVLLLSLIFVLLVVPVAASLSFAEELLHVGITTVLILAAIATRRRRTLIVAGVSVAAIAAPLSWMTMFVRHPYLFASSCVLNSLFFVTMAVVILMSVIRKHLATIHSIFGAISAYLLLGLAWAVMYWGLDHLDDRAFQINPQVLQVPAATIGDSSAEVNELSQFVYFSFVTMSTLGYGDITPRTTLAQTLTWVQSVVGQFYIAVCVAWLVSEIPSKHGANATP